MLKKKRVGIVTITNSEDNYGNMLQNYALTKVIQKMGYSVETIYNLYGKRWRRYDLYIIPKLIKQKKQAIRPWEFFLFRKKYLNYSIFYVDERKQSFNRIKNRYYKVVCGSDQVWNPIFPVNHNWTYNLVEFMKPTQKLSYAASIGVNSLDVELENRFKEAFDAFPNISVREQDAADLIFNLTGRRPKIHIDPTMLLSTEEWDKIATPVKDIIPGSYILKYVLGDVNELIDNYVSGKSDNKRLQIIDLLDKDSRYYNLGPCEFIWLIKNAKEVITDSFHATVFSIIYRKQFVVFQRLGKHLQTFGRLQTLLKKFQLENHIWGASNFNPSDFNKRLIIETICEEKVKSLDYLKNALT